MVIITLILLNLMIFLKTPYSYIIQTKLSSRYSSCDGIQKYYTDTKFTMDVDELIFKGNSCYKNMDEKRLKKLYAPKDLENCSGKIIDCEDISHMIMCLAKEYNQTCKYYVEMSTFDRGHLGIICLIENKWSKFY